MYTKHFRKSILGLFTAFILAACGGGGSSISQPPSPPLTYSIGGTVSGLQGSGLVLQNNGGDDLALSANGNFSFDAELPAGASYSIAVIAQPTGPSQTCAISSGSGNVTSVDVSNISISCMTDAFNIAVTVSGLKGSGLMLRNNGADDLAVDNDGDYAFSAQVNSGANYDVRVFGEPTDPDQACRVGNATGVVGDTDVSGIEVNCAALAVKDVFAGDLVSCAILENSRAKCWGNNATGNLALGDNLARGKFPGEMGNDLEYTMLGPSADVVQIATGFHSCAVLSDGDLKCWGENGEGQLGLGDSEDRGDQPDEVGGLLPKVNLGGETVITVGTGGGHSCALLSNNAIKCWGRGLNGVLGQGSTARIGAQPGEMGNNLDAVALGNLAAFAEDLAVGANHNCAVRNIGGLVCWGYNAFGQLGVGHRESVGDEPGEMGLFLSAVNLGSNGSAVQVVAGNSHTCAILDTGFVKCWGRNDRGQLGRGDIEHRGDDPDELGDDLSIISLGSVVNPRVNQLAAGGEHTCALLVNGAVKCWGSNNRGQLGHGDQENRGDQANEMGSDLPTVDLGSGRTAVRIAAGAEHSCAVLDNQDVKCWGENSIGQLGQEHVSDLGDAANEMGDNLAPIDIGSQ